MMTRRLLLGAGLAMGASGCWGSFGLTKKFYDWNAGVGGKWVNWLIFFLFCIIPVYEVCLLVDALVINSIEFWSGSNPMGGVTLPPPSSQRVIDNKDGTITTLSRVDATTMRIVRTGPSGEFLSGIDLVMEGENAGQVRDLDGQILVTNERLSDGTLAVTYNGETTFVSPAQQQQVASAQSPALAARELLPSGQAVAMR